MTTERTVDYLHTIGASNYSPESFLAEARTQGISRRLAQVPANLTVGQSRVYCLFGAGRDSAIKGCPSCSAKLPPPARGSDGIPRTLCPNRECLSVYEGKLASKGSILGFFVPEAIEVVVRVTESEARAMVEGYVGLLQLTGEASEVKLVDEPGRLLVQLTASTGAEMDLAKAISQMAGASVNADLTARVLGLPGSRIVAVVSEPDRGCGRRHSGAIYSICGPSATPFVEIAPVIYDGQHFRGVKELTEDESAALDRHVLGQEVLVSLPLPERQLELVAA